MKDSFTEIKLESIIKNPNQPRKEFDEDKINSLSISIRENGLIQPIIVSKYLDKYLLIAGERRLRAFELLGKKKIPAIIKNCKEENIFTLALIENIQRNNLNPIEEARAYENLIKAQDLTQESIANKLGKSRSYITNSLRLLKLPNQVLELIKQKELSQAHGRTLLGLKTNNKIIEYALLVRKNNLSVRELESLVKKENNKEDNQEKDIKTNVLNNHEIDYLKECLTNKFGTKVSVSMNKNYKGKLEIEYYGLEDLERVLEELGIELED